MFFGLIKSARIIRGYFFIFVRCVLNVFRFVCLYLEVFRCFLGVFIVNVRGGERGC